MCIPCVMCGQCIDETLDILLDKVICPTCHESIDGKKMVCPYCYQLLSLNGGSKHQPLQYLM